MSALDIAVFVGYGVIIIFIGSYLSRTKKSEPNSNDYFFAGNTLPWYLIGTSIIAANISAEQFIGMSGSGYAIGLGIATYEWVAALVLIVVAKFFLPVLVHNRIHTMPEFMEFRYDYRIKTILAILWLSLFIFVNLTSILYLGALTLKTLLGVELIYAIIGLAVFTLLYSVVNGLKAIASTDIIQVGFLVAGGLLTTYLSLDAVSDGNGAYQGLRELIRQAPEKFHMVIPKSSPDFEYLPGIRAIFGGIWIAGIYYFGINQYIIQKALGSKSLKEAQRGMVFAGYLKLLLPMIVVVPGIAAYALGADLTRPDQAYPWLLDTFIPSGIRGFVSAALIAAIVSSLSAIVNGTSTIFTMDIYKNYVKRKTSDKELIGVGRLAGILAMTTAAIIAPFLGRIEQAFQFIQEFTGFVSPGISAIFVLGLFWKKTTAKSALRGILLSVILTTGFKFMLPEMPFLDKMLLAFIITVIFIVVLSYLEGKGKKNPDAIELDKDLYKTDFVFNVASIMIILILIALYTAFW